MEEKQVEDFSQLPVDVQEEILRRIDEGTIRYFDPEDPIIRQIPPSYWLLDLSFINTLVQAGVKNIPGITIEKRADIQIRHLKGTHEELGKSLEEGRVDGETHESMVARIVQKTLMSLARVIYTEKIFLNLARDSYRQVHGSPTRGRLPLREDCFWAIDSSLGPLGYGFPRFHWVRRAHIGGHFSLPEPFNDISQSHVRPTMAALIRMIQSKVTDSKTGRKLPESTARKYARLWEADVYRKSITMSERWDLHKALTKAKKAKP